MILNSEDTLRDVYGNAKGRAKDKVLPALEKHSIQFVEKSPFVVISTSDSSGRCDTSPRGGEPGFVKILDSTHILLPDSKGNNRVDSMSNIVSNAQIGMLFLIPGVDETLRINGSVEICTGTDYLSQFQSDFHPPKSVLLVSIEEVFLHCAKALMRSKLWKNDYRVERSSLPTTSQMLNDQIGKGGEDEPQDAMVKRYKKEL